MARENQQSNAAEKKSPFFDSFQMADIDIEVPSGTSRRGLYHAPVIPARIWQNPAELFLAESPAKIAIPGTIYSGRIEPFRNWDWNRIQWNAVCINDKSTMDTPSGMFLSHRGVHRALKMT